MKTLLAFAMLLASPLAAWSCERSLVGTWTSDGPRTMAFVREHAKLPQKTVDFLQALVGHMTMTFSGTTLHLVVPNAQAPVAGQLRPVAGFEERKPYKLLFCSDSMIVWSAQRSFGVKDVATTLHFVGPDTVWIYNGSSEPGMPDLHAREYFERVR